MPLPFAITTANDSVALDKDGVGRATFTVSNVSGAQARGRAKVVTGDPAQEKWYTVDGDVERTVRGGLETVFTIRAAVPPTTAKGDFSLRLDVVVLDTVDPQTVPGPQVKVPWSGPRIEEKKKFPWWIVAAAAMVLIVGGVVAWLFLRDTSVKVPDVVGMSFTEASKKLEESGLAPEKGDTKVDRSKDADTVVDQDPKKDADAEKKATVRLTVTTKNLKKVPNVKDKIADAAEKELSSAGFKVQRAAPVLRAGTPAGVVVGQDPAGDTDAPAESAVVLSVTGDAVQVPPLKGKVLNDSVAVALHGQGLLVSPTSVVAKAGQQLGEILSVTANNKSVPDNETVARGTPLTLTLARPAVVTEAVYMKAVNDLLTKHGIKFTPRFIRDIAVFDRVKAFPAGGG